MAPPDTLIAVIAIEAAAKLAHLADTEYGVLIGRHHIYFGVV